MQRICLLMVVLFSITLIAYGQGTPGILRCSRGTFDIHASRDPGSAIVARIQCGTAVLLIDEQFGSYHLRLEDGTDGYIITRNFGQFTIQPEGEPISQSVPGRAPTSRPAVVTVPVAPNPSGGSEGFPRMEIFGGYSFIRPDVPGRCERLKNVRDGEEESRICPVCKGEGSVSVPGDPHAIERVLEVVGLIGRKQPAIRIEKNVRVESLDELLRIGQRASDRPATFNEPNQL